MIAGVNTWDSWAAAWWSWVLHSSWQVAIVVGVIWGVTRLDRRQSASFRCALWLLVFVKLLVPPTLTAPWSIGTVAQHAAEASGYVEWVRPLEHHVTTPLENPDQFVPATHMTNAATDAPNLTLRGLAFAIWAMVSSGMALTIAIQYVRYRRRVLKTLTPPPDWLGELVAAQVSRLQLSQSPSVRLIDGGGVPSVFGILRPLVLIPETWLKEFDRSALTDVITHELAHVKRRDLPVGWGVTALTCCYWFHPLVWVAHLHIRREREMACDDWVLWSNARDGKEYAGTILKGAESSSGMVPAGAGFLGLMELSENLLHRIRSAGDAHRKRSMGIRSVLTLCVIVLVLFPMQCVTTGASPTDLDFSSEPPADHEAEMALYEPAGPEVHAFIKHTTESFGRSGLWLTVGARDALSRQEREDRVTYIAEVLEGHYGRHQCESLAEAGVIRDARLLPGLVEVAQYHLDDRDYDCRAKWMAVAALGRQGDGSAVPVLIPLVDHGNLNTRLWARGSLVRLTGQNFNDDKRAWGAWWNSQGIAPALTEEALSPWVAPGASKQTGVESEQLKKNLAILEEIRGGVPPELVSSVPPIGAIEVDPDSLSIVVTFDQDMAKSFSWTGGGEYYPDVTSKPRWLDKRTIELPVKLESGRLYRVGINSTSHRNFASASGVPARNRVLYFVTAGADAETLAKAQPPKVAAKAVSEGGDSISVTFDRPMGGGASWTKAGGQYPETTGRFEWSEDKQTCTLPVVLETGERYSIGLNSVHHINFQSEQGIPSDPVVWEFIFVGKGN